MINNTVLNHNNRTFSDAQIRKIGNEIASLWGGSCYDYRIGHDINSVIFYCIEHGEKFITAAKFEDLDEYLTEV